MAEGDAKSSFLQALQRMRQTELNNFLREALEDGSMVMQYSSKGNWELVFKKTTKEINELWIDRRKKATNRGSKNPSCLALCGKGKDDTNRGTKNPSYFVDYVLCGKGKEELVFRRTTSKGKNVNQTFEYTGSLKPEHIKPPLSHPLLQQQPGSANKRSSTTPCLQESAANNQPYSSQETTEFDDLEFRGSQPQPKRQRINELGHIQPQMSTVQRPKTVESIHRPETLNVFKENPDGLPPSYDTEDDIELDTRIENLEFCKQILDQLANGTCTENLELHNQSLHQTANVVEALLSSVDAEALLSSIEDTEDSDGQRKEAGDTETESRLSYPDSETVDVYPEVLDSNFILTDMSDSGHVPYLEDSLQCGTAPDESQSEVASSKENDRMQCSADDISANSGHYQASQEGSTSPDNINCGHVPDLPGYIDLLTSLDGDVTGTIKDSMLPDKHKCLMSPMTELVISPSFSSCKGGERLVVTGVQPKDGEKYYIRFEGKQGRRCVSAEVEGTVLCARSPSYPSPEIVKAYVDVVDSNQDQSNGMAPVDFEFTVDMHLQCLSWHQLALQLNSRLSEPCFFHSFAVMSAPKLKGWVHSALEILPEPARLKAYEMEVHAKELEALEKMELMCKCWCEDDCSDYTRTLEILPHNNKPLYASPVLFVGHFRSKIKQLRGQGTPINSKLIDEIGIFINHVGLNKGTLLQLDKWLGSDVKKHFKQSKPAECNEDDDTEVATLHQVKELLAIAGTTGLCIEEIIACVRGLQESSCRVDFLEIPDCLNMDVLHEFEELIVGMKACQLENRSHSLSEPCDILIAEEGVQNSCEEIWNDAGHCDMDALHEFEELIVGMEACQLECRPPSLSGPCDASEVEEILQNSCEEIWNDAEDIRKDYLGDTDREDHSFDSVQ